jgi:hypothetical protein
LERLSRGDKWYLSAGDGILWAPAFPIWLHAPGFWDEAHVYYHPFAPLFTVALVGEDGREIPLKQLSRAWRPDRLVCRYRAADGQVLIETREALGRGRFSSTWTIEGFDSAWTAAPGLSGLHLVAYTAQPGPQVVKASRPGASSIRWRRSLVDRREQNMDIDATLSVSLSGEGSERPPAHVRAACVRSEGSSVEPQWRFAPFMERWESKRGLREEMRLEGINTMGLVYAALDAPLDAVDAPAVRFSIELRVGELPPI